MAARKPVTTDAVAEVEDVEVQSVEDRIAEVVENTDESIVAEVEDVDYVKVKSPFGAVSTVPKGILEPLLDSGYVKSK
jgi:hypothetical protein